MAVLKSSALGQVRKSIGPTNYYRRSGVQIARSKPVFAPGRTFTPAQLDQQWRMQVVQYLMLTIGLGKCSNCANVINNRLYNASSRYNRAVKLIMLNQWEYGRDEFPLPADMWKNGWEMIGEKWSIGDVKGVPGTLTMDRTSSGWRLRVGGMNILASELMRLTNKRRQPSGQLDAHSIGLCGMFQNEGAGKEGTWVQLPKFCLNVPISGADYYEFYLDIDLPVATGQNIWANLVFFIADGHNTSIAPVDIVALHCTDSTGWMPTRV